MDENQKRSWVLATLTEDIQDYVADRADALEREHGIDLDEADRAKSLAWAAKPAVSENERQASADEVAAAVLPDLHKAAGLIAVAPGLAHTVLLEVIADLVNPMDLVANRVQQARAEAAKEHACMVRQLKGRVGVQPFVARMLEELAAAIEKDAKR